MSLVTRIRNGVRKPFAWMLFAVCLTTCAVAQEYRTDNVDEAAKRNAVFALAGVKDRNRYDKEKVQDYFANYYFPDMTRSGPDDLARLGDSRYNLFKRYLWATSNTDLQRDLTDMAFKAMGRIVVSQDEPPYHPAVRYNAILILGMLDAEYAIDIGATARPPKPLPAATKALIFVVDKATTSNQFPPPVVLGALIGLERHARYRDALEPGTANAMTAALLKLVNQAEPIQEMDPAAYAWLRLRAASALAQLGGVGQNNAVHDALLKLVGDFKSLDDRCASAALLAKLKYEGVKIDAAAATEQFFKLARELGAEEAKRAQEYDDMRLGGGGSFVSARAERFVPTDASGEQDSFPRRQVLARLIDLRRGLRAVKPAVPEESQKKIDAVLDAMKPAIDAAADKGTITLRLTEVIRTMADAIDEAAPPAEPAAEEPAAEAPAAGAEEAPN